MRRRLTWYYILFYVASFLLIVFQSWFLYKPVAFLTCNCGLWIPQIIKSFRNRSRKVPPTQLVVAMLALQSLLPLYLKLSPYNFLEVQEDYLTGSAMLLMMIAQVLILRSQQLWGSRWFVPEKWRRNPNAY